MRAFLKSLTDFVYTPKCVSCQKPSEGYICSNCLGHLHFFTGQVSAKINNNYSKLFSMVSFEGPVLQIVHKFKYGRGGSANQAVSNIIDRYEFSIEDFDVLVPVPLGRFRYTKRGYNQSLIIAGIISKKLGRPILRRALCKTKKTSRQVGLPLEKRRGNLMSAFRVPMFFWQGVKGKRVLLIDDVVTTGATIDECSKVLLRAGALKVDVLTLAKTM